METKNEYGRKIEQATLVAGRLASKLHYHDFNHEVDVYSSVSVLAGMENLSQEDRFVLKTSALFHDALFKPGYQYNEEVSAKWAKRCLPHLGYSGEQTEKVKRLILATKMPTHPGNLLEKIICDADLANLGRDDFFERGEALRMELGAENGKKWYESQKKFLESHEYYTASAKYLWDEGKKKNIEELDRRIKSLEEAR